MAKQLFIITIQVSGTTFLKTCEQLRVRTLKNEQITCLIILAFD